MKAQGPLLVALGVLLWASVAHADCADLQYQRNAIYKRAGYCFKTALQITIFGNAGCRYDDQADVPLSARDRARIAAIVREEHLVCR